MRDAKRIDEFCNELAKIWKINCPDWRFGQLITNVLGDLPKGNDIFFPEDNEIMGYFRDYFKGKK